MNAPSATRSEASVHRFIGSIELPSTKSRTDKNRSCSIHFSSEGRSHSLEWLAVLTRSNPCVAPRPHCCHFRVAKTPRTIDVDRTIDAIPTDQVGRQRKFACLRQNRDLGDPISGAATNVEPHRFDRRSSPHPDHESLIVQSPGHLAPHGCAARHRDQRACGIACARSGCGPRKPVP